MITKNTKKVIQIIKETITKIKTGTEIKISIKTNGNMKITENKDIEEMIGNIENENFIFKFINWKIEKFDLLITI